MTLAERRFVLSPFVAMMRALPMDLPELFDMYVGKNVLNNFRQDHGYKTGAYRKLWHGREDNEHLMEALRALRCAPEEVPTALYAALEERYRG